MIEGVDEQPDWAAWHRKKTGNEPNYSEVLDALSSADERRSILHSYIEPTPDDIQTTESPNAPTMQSRGSCAKASSESF